MGIARHDCFTRPGGNPEADVLYLAKGDVYGWDATGRLVTIGDAVFVCAGAWINQSGVIVDVARVGDEYVAAVRINGVGVRVVKTRCVYLRTPVKTPELLYPW